MSDYEKEIIDLELRLVVFKKFEKPSRCTDLEDIRHYVHELCITIEDYKKRFDYVPAFAYTLLSKYNARQNRILNNEFHNLYCS